MPWPLPLFQCHVQHWKAGSAPGSRLTKKRTIRLRKSSKPKITEFKHSLSLVPYQTSTLEWLSNQYLSLSTTGCFWGQEQHWLVIHYYIFGKCLQDFKFRKPTPDNIWRVYVLQRLSCSAYYIHQALQISTPLYTPKQPPLLILCHIKHTIDTQRVYLPTNVKGQEGHEPKNWFFSSHCHVEFNRAVDEIYMYLYHLCHWLV